MLGEVGVLLAGGLEDAGQLRQAQLAVVVRVGAVEQLRRLVQRLWLRRHATVNISKTWTPICLGPRHVPSYMPQEHGQGPESVHRHETYKFAESPKTNS